MLMMGSALCTRAHVYETNLVVWLKLKLIGSSRRTSETELVVIGHQVRYVSCSTANTEREQSPHNVIIEFESFRLVDLSALIWQQTAPKLIDCIKFTQLTHAVRKKHMRAQFVVDYILRCASTGGCLGARRLAIHYACMLSICVYMEFNQFGPYLICISLGIWPNAAIEANIETTQKRWEMKRERERGGYKSGMK